MQTLYLNYNDAQLIDLLTRDRDESAFAEIYRRYGKELLRDGLKKVGDRSVAEDLVQEVFVVLWQKKDTLLIQKNILAYLKGMLKYHVIDYFASSRNSPEIPSASIPHLPDPEESDYLEGTFLMEQYREALSKLPPKCREVFELSRNGHTAREIADALKISEKTVEVHIGKALRILRMEMKDYLPLLLIMANFFRAR